MHTTKAANKCDLTLVCFCFKCAETHRQKVLNQRPQYKTIFGGNFDVPLSGECFYTLRFSCSAWPCWWCFGFVLTTCRHKPVIRRPEEVAFQQNVPATGDAQSSSGEQRMPLRLRSSPGERRHGSARCASRRYRGCVWVLPYAHDQAPAPYHQVGVHRVVRVEMESPTSATTHFPRPTRMAGIQRGIYGPAPTSRK